MKSHENITEESSYAQRIEWQVKRFGHGSGSLKSGAVHAKILAKHNIYQLRRKFVRNTVKSGGECAYDFVPAQSVCELCASRQIRGALK